MRTMGFRVIDNVFLIVFGMSDPTEEEWVKYLKALEAPGIEKTVQLFYSEGGKPSPRQRKELVKLLANRAVPMAVLSNKRRVRMMVDLLSWFNRQIRAFPIGGYGLRDALEYLSVQPSKFQLIDDELSQLILSVRMAA